MDPIQRKAAAEAISALSPLSNLISQLLASSSSPTPSIPISSLTSSLRQSLSALSSIISTVSPKCLQIAFVFDQAALPLANLFASTNNPSLLSLPVREAALDCLSTLFDRIGSLPETPVHFKSLFGLLSKIFNDANFPFPSSSPSSPPSKGAEAEPRSSSSKEEIHIKSLQCFASFIKCACNSASHRSTLTHPSMQSHLAYFVTAALSVSTSLQSSKSVRQTAMETLNTFIDSLPVSTVWRWFLPGCVSSTLRILSSSTPSSSASTLKPSSRLVASSYKFIGRLLTCTCADSSYSIDVFDAVDKKSLLSSSSSSSSLSSSSTAVTAFNQWISKAAAPIDAAASSSPSIDSEASNILAIRGRLGFALSHMFSAESINKFQSKQHVKDAASTAAHNLIVYCKRFLGPAIVYPLECLMMTSASSLLTDATSALTSIDNDDSLLKSLLADRFSLHLSELKREIISSVLEEKKSAALHLIASYLSCFSSSNAFMDTFLSPSSLPLLSKSLFSALEIEKMESVSLLISSLSSAQECTQYPRILFKHVFSEHAVASIKSICHSMALNSKHNIPLTTRCFSHFFDLLRNSQPSTSSTTASVVWILNEMAFAFPSLKAIAAKQRQQQVKDEFSPQAEAEEEDQEDGHLTAQEEIMNSIIDEYLQTRWTELVDVPPPGSSAAGVDKNTRELIVNNGHILSLMLQGIGTAATRLRISSLQKHMLKCLTHFLEKMGSENPIVSSAAKATLTLLAQHIFHDKISRPQQAVAMLVSQNADYVVDDVCFKMRYLAVYPRIPFVLLSLLECCSFSSSSSLPSSSASLWNPDEDVKTETGRLSMTSLLEDIMRSSLIALDSVRAQAAKARNTASETYKYFVDSFLRVLHSAIKLIRSRHHAREQYLRYIRSVRAAAAAAAQQPKPLVAKEDKNEEEKKNIEEISEYFAEYEEEKKKREMLGDAFSGISPEEEDEGQEGEEEEEEKEEGKETNQTPAQREAAMARDVLAKCGYYLHSKSLTMSTSVFELMDESIRACTECVSVLLQSSSSSSSSSSLSDKYKLEANYLPMVHEVWPSILQKASTALQQSSSSSSSSSSLQKMASIRALDLCRTLMELHGDFMRSRFQKELWPHIRVYLHEQAAQLLYSLSPSPTPSPSSSSASAAFGNMRAISSKIDIVLPDGLAIPSPCAASMSSSSSSSADKYSVDSKLLRSVLFLLRDSLAQSSSISAANQASEGAHHITIPLYAVAQDIARTMVPFLHDQLAEDLQQTAREIFKYLSQTDGDACWLILNELSGTTTIQPPALAAQEGKPLLSLKTVSFGRHRFGLQSNKNERSGEAAAAAVDHYSTNASLVLMLTQ